MPNHTIYRLPAVINRTGLSRSTVYNLISDGEFPAPVRLGKRSVGWVDEDIDAWIAHKISQSSGERQSRESRTVLQGF